MHRLLLNAEAVGDVLVALLQVIPTLVIAYLLLDPPGRALSQEEAAAAQQQDKRLDDEARDASNAVYGPYDPDLTLAEREIEKTQRKAERDKANSTALRFRRERRRILIRYFTVAIAAMAGMAISVNGALSVASGLPVEIPGVGQPPGAVAGIGELFWAFVATMFIISEIAVVGVRKVAQRSGVDEKAWVRGTYAATALVVLIWLFLFVQQSVPPQATAPESPSSPPSSTQTAPTPDARIVPG